MENQIGTWKKINGKDYNMKHIFSIHETQETSIRGDFSGTYTENYTVYTFINGVVLKERTK